MKRGKRNSKFALCTAFAAYWYVCHVVWLSLPAATCPMKSARRQCWMRCKHFLPDWTHLSLLMKRIEGKIEENR